MYYTDDPIRDYERYSADQERWLKRRPVCRKCGHHIQESEAYYTDKGWICEHCADESCYDGNRVEVEDYI